ncbi:MAG: TlpA family protein disulfide reductase [Planctomycetes bacterium]|nr:TlpA family protein disulfide reductase [Planctomycetota bacterium]
MGLLSLTIAISTSVSSAPPSLRGLVDPSPGQLAVYEGSSVTRQTTPGRPVAEMEYVTALAYLVLPAAPGGGAARRLVLVRSVAPRSSALALPPYGDAEVFQLLDLDLVPAGPPDPAPHLKVLEAQLPPALFPAFELREGESAAEVEVTVPGASRAKAAVVAAMTEDGSTATVTRTLAEGAKASAALEGSPAAVEAWRETVVIDRARKAVVELRREVKLSGSRAGEALGLETRSELKAKEVRSLSAAELAQVAELERDVVAAIDSFRSKQHPRTVYERIQAVSGRPLAKLVPGLEDALLSRLSFYRQAREREEREAARAGAAGTEAPDFVLEDLEGRKVSFREAVKGKVTLLSFWGYGCPPCRTEAPYLSKLVERYGDKGLAVIAVNAYDEDKGLVKSFVENLGLKQRVLLKGGATARQKFQVTGFPTVFWIDHRWKIVHKEVGFLPASFPAMEARAEALLAAAKRAAEGSGGD